MTTILLSLILFAEAPYQTPREIEQQIQGVRDILQRHDGNVSQQLYENSIERDAAVRSINSKFDGLAPTLTRIADELKKLNGNFEKAPQQSPLEMFEQMLSMIVDASLMLGGGIVVAKSGAIKKLLNGRSPE